ncbi:MAG: glycosyltransferase family 1 protein [Candidatus Wallbacteria bacterium]|nr:glycosyltransferase family 1 protein [Candidatus Wallbacteria bacterium]
MKKLRVGVYLNAVPHSGGAFQYNLSILEAVSGLSEDLYSKVACFSNPQWMEVIKKYNVECKYAGNFNLGNLAYKVVRKLVPITEFQRAISPLLFPVARTVMKENCDIWIFPTEDELSYQIPVPALTTIYDLMHRYEPRFPEVSGKRIYHEREMRYQNICRYCKGILVDSEIGKNQVIETYGIKTEKVFSLPFIAPDYIYSSVTNEDFDRRHQLPKKFLFYPAQFWEHKNHKNLLKAIAKLTKDLPDLKIVFVGSKKNVYGSIKRLTMELDLLKQVVFLGYVSNSDLAALYRRARALIMPTYFGPTNIPPLEAFVSGCPAAVSKIYGMPEQVGDAALLFNPDSIDEISKCIEMLWKDDDLCAKLISSGREKGKKWGPSQFRERLKEIIEKVCTATT